MADGAPSLNVASNAPVDKYRTPNRNPQFDTESTDVFTARTGSPINSPGVIDVVTGGTGQPVSNGG